MVHGKVGRAAPSELTRLCRGRLGSVASRCLAHFVGWMLLGFIIAGPNLPSLHSQSRLDEKKRDSKRQAAPATEPSPPPPTEIILPDIYISAATDSVSALKQRLKNAESYLQKLHAERNRILKAIESMEKRARARQNPASSRPMEPVVRPSV